LTSAEARTVAFMDLGTNSIHLLLVRIQPDYSYVVLTQLKQTVRLGEGAFIHQHLQPDAIDRAVFVARQFAQVARAHGAETIIAVATAATREAVNQATFVQQLQQEADLDVRVVSGLEEARLISLGVASGVHLSERQALFLDIGGGSTEVIIGTQHHQSYLGSLKLGAIRLTSQFLTDTCGAVAPHQYEALYQYIRRHAMRTLHALRTYRIDLAFGSSGTIENLADIAVRHYLKRPRQHDDVLTYAQLRQVIAMLRDLPLESRRKAPGLHPERADIIIAGAAILDVFMRELALHEIRVSARGVREGLLVDYLLKHGASSLLQEMSVRARSVWQLGRACQFDEAHARTTARLALALFDSARHAGLHRFGAWERELLEYTAVLHHIGAFLHYTDYQTHTAYLIRHAHLLGFDQTEIAIMATTALYHHKALPRKKSSAFAALDQRAQQIVQLSSALLCLAENLDRGHAGFVQGARLCVVDTQHVALHIDATHDCQVEVWGVQKHLAAFEKVLGRQLVIKVRQQTPAQLATA
jgi:exopolyphosphatase / guanosine-5'-triphosphate,3'-diphosphate pyrophosphatase